ncbi:MAG: DUF1501 domain-containing protein [Bryobacteraceae bacterium]|nr:DUF1501 domain-containing protein [Bryobacteraceae bacterium]
MLTRRQALFGMGAGFGAAAFAAENPLAVKQPHFTARAKHVIFLFLNGGLSQVDTFDPKPALARYHGQPMPGGNPRTERTTGSLMRSPFAFRRFGQSGIEVSEIFPGIGSMIDDICIVKSCYTKNPIHESCLFMMNCGDIQAGRPSFGSWLTYGLGTENQNLPGFVVLCPGVPVVGPPLWNSAFLPAAHQGTHVQNSETNPKKLIPNIVNHAPEATQRKQIGLLEKLNRRHAAARAGDQELEATIHAMEVAFRMQTEAPDVFDVTKEPEAVRTAYGEGHFARGCLLARRLVERGVRMVQIYFGNGQPWDNHDDILIHRKLAGQSDKPIAALLGDLKQRGMLGETLVIIGSEFGRTPSVENSAAVKIQNGRDHNPYGFSTLLAGGGIRGGMSYGATDEFGFRAAENPVHVHDLHATALHLLGLDHTRLTYRYSGRDFRLTDVGGRVIRDILA